MKFWYDNICISGKYCLGKKMEKNAYPQPWILPLPLRPTNRRSLNLATWFFMMALALRSSPHQFSSLPALMVTSVPSVTSPRATTLKATGSVLLERQWVGSAEQMMEGEPVRISSPGCSFITSLRRRSPGKRNSDELLIFLLGEGIQVPN